MAVNLCAECYLQGHCRRMMSRVVTRDELKAAFIADVRRMMRSLDLSRDAWLPFLLDAYCNYPGRIVDADDKEVWLDTSVFDVDSIRYWFRDLCRPIPQGVRVRLKRNAIPRFIVTASILRATYPVEASLWGKVIANDQDRDGLPQPVRIAGCPYLHFPAL